MQFTLFIIILLEKICISAIIIITSKKLTNEVIYMNAAIETKSNGTIYPKKITNKRDLYEHQKKAMKNLDIMNRNNSYSTLVVLPTGGGKIPAYS